MVETAIIFDCFGVLATDGWLPFRNKQFGEDKSLLLQADRLNKQMDTGFISYKKFVMEIAILAGVSEEVVDSNIDSNVPNEELLQYISKELKPNYKIGILSNAGANWLDTIFTTEQLSMFDAVMISYEAGVVKPEPLAYEIIAQRLDVPLGACVFIDDQERYCVGAQTVGMQAIKYTNFAQLKRDLTAILESEAKSAQ